MPGTYWEKRARLATAHFVPSTFLPSVVVRLAHGAQSARKVTRAALCCWVELVFLKGNCFESNAWAGESMQRDLWPGPGLGRTRTRCMDSHTLCRTPCVHFRTSV